MNRVGCAGGNVYWNNKRALLLQGPFVIAKQIYAFSVLLDFDKAIRFNAAFGASFGWGGTLFGQTTYSTLPFYIFGHGFLLAIVEVHSEDSFTMGSSFVNIT